MNIPAIRSVCAAGALIFAALLGGCSRGAVPAGEEAGAHEDPGSSGRVVLASDVLAEAGIETGIAGPGAIAVSLELPAEVKLDAERTVEVRPPYPGTLRELHAALGGAIRAGQPLAVIRSSESLADYTVAAPRTGTVVTRPVNPGAAVDRETVLCTLADLGTVWVEFPVYAQQLGRVRRGLPVEIRAEGDPAATAHGSISYVGAVLDPDTRVTFARVELANRGGRWQPGRMVTAVVVLERVVVPVAVPEDAIVRMGEGAAVFLADSTGFTMHAVVIGRSDGTLTEIRSGLAAGARIATRNTFLLKAELEKEAGGDED